MYYCYLRKYLNSIYEVIKRFSDLGRYIFEDYKICAKRQGVIEDYADIATGDPEN